MPVPLQSAELPHDAVEIGRIAEAWGIKGWFRVHSHSADPQALFFADRWFLQAPQGRYARGFDAFAGTVLAPVGEIKPHADGLVAHIEGLTDRNAAEALKGARIFIARNDFPEPEEGEFYWVDLIGLDVVNREGLHLGVVRDLLPTGPHAVLCLEYPLADGQPGERMIPFVSAYVDQVDRATRRITVDWQPDY
jgi:16S rRNA processing protein RimM